MRIFFDSSFTLVKGIDMNTTEVGITVYEETNVIECPRCAKHLSFDDLVQKEGNSGCIAGKQWHSTYYYCVCNSEKVLVFDWGDGSHKRLINGTIVKKE
ncbi:MAG: hypothetical protein A2904_00520 [Candidatus Staskawiczbacteria bacterium RIFCSPLOWO2_01_FULL_33_9]|uniref:Uncharacterized protein n=1 Tax=Candidatus Staskawiczbacteria bacterium RIFCSPLOWO2_01_FULL_33_9 TaxID=1802211 RepID=A0A1G2I8P5_9BACT|nr:MAG: hypothetical protein A2904_00520 [Candidatus Staskawiczbacteria bacterium RIFCSPLOWO2_01_FULL_33_9]